MSSPTLVVLLLVGVCCLGPAWSFSMPPAQGPARKSLDPDVVRFRCKNQPIGVIDAGEHSKCFGLEKDLTSQGDQYWSIPNALIAPSARHIYTACDRGEWEEDKSPFFPILEGNDNWASVKSSKCKRVFWEHSTNPCLGEVDQMKEVHEDPNGDIIVCMSDKKP